MTKEEKIKYLKWVDGQEINELERRKAHHKERLLILETKLEEKKRVDTLQMPDTKKG